MKKYCYLFLKLFIVFCVIFTNDVFAFDFKVSSDKVLLINLNDDSILYEKNSDDKTYIASITKIMTAIVALENIDDLNANNKILYDDISSFSYDVALSHLKLNTNYTNYELLHGLMLESGADCAHALARIVGGNVPNFVKMMNDKAIDLGMTNTKFANPTGLDDKNNYSTARDVSILFKYALENEDFYKIMSTMTYKVDNISLKNTILSNKERYDLSLPYLIGGKTGTEDKAGYCLASIATYNDIDYMLIVLNSKKAPGNFVDTKNIYEYYMNNYNYYTLVSEGDVFNTFDTKYLREKSISVSSSKDYSYYLENDYEDKIRFDFDGVGVIDPSFDKGDLLGTYTIYYNDDVLDEISIYLDEDVHFSLISFIIYHKDIFTIGCLSLVFVVIFVLLFVKFLRKRKFEN